MVCNDKEIKKLQEARNRLGDRAEWELRNMKKALSMFPILNSPEENQRLEDVNTTLKLRNRCVKK